MNLETRLLNVLRKNPIPTTDTAGKYKAALTRLARKGIAICKAGTWQLTLRAQLRN